MRHTGDPQDRAGLTAFAGVNGCRHRSAGPPGPPVWACRSGRRSGRAGRGAGLGGRRVAGQQAGLDAGIALAIGLDSLGTGPFRACLLPRAGRGLGRGDAAIMAEQAIVGVAGLLRQLRAGAGLTQQELAKAAGLSLRSVSDLERGINRTARQDTAVRLAGALGLAEPVRSLFVAAALGRIGAAQVLAARRGQAPGGSPASAGGMHGFVPALTSFVGRAGPVREVAGLAGPQPAGDGDRAGRHGEDPARCRGGRAGGGPVRGRGVAGGAGAGRGPSAGRGGGGGGAGGAGSAGGAGGRGGGAGAGPPAVAAGAG